MKFYTYVAVALLFALTSALSVFAQCNPNPLFENESHGIYPQGSVGLDCSGLGADLTVVAMSDTAVEMPVGGLTQLYFDAQRLDSVVGLPSGLSVETDVMGSASGTSPYGDWVYGGSNPNYIPSLGCLRISGSANAISAASTGGPNNDGVYPVTFYLDYRVAYTDPDISFLIANGSWLGESGLGGAGVGLPNGGFEVLLDINGSSCGSAFVVSPEVTANTDTTQGCDGSVTTQVFGGQPPYSFAYSSGAFTQTVNGLCPGIYNVTVTDSNGDTETVQFAVGVESNVYSNVNPSGLPSGLDSLFFSTGNCDLDYSLPIDSFSVVNAMASGNDTLIVEWVIYQNGSPFNVLSFYPDGNPDPTVLSLVLFCENGRAELGVFQLFEYLESPVLVGIQDEQELQLSVRPNPSDGLFEIAGDWDEGAELRVFDLSGKVVYLDYLLGNNQHHLDITLAKKGIYILEITSGGQRSYQKLVKQ